MYHTCTCTQWRIKLHLHTVMKIQLQEYTNGYLRNHNYVLCMNNISYLYYKIKFNSIQYYSSFSTDIQPPFNFICIFHSTANSAPIQLRTANSTPTKMSFNSHSTVIQPPFNWLRADYQLYSQLQWGDGTQSDIKPPKKSNIRYQGIPVPPHPPTVKMANHTFLPPPPPSPPPPPPLYNRYYILAYKSKKLS